MESSTKGQTYQRGGLYYDCMGRHSVSKLSKEDIMSDFIKWTDIDFKKSRGKEKVICPNCSETRTNKTDKSLYIDHDDGYGKCFYCSALAFEKTNEPTEKKYDLPDQRWKNHTNLSDKVVKYFSGRGISQRTLIECKITEEKHYQPALQKEVNNIVFNYFEGSQIVNKKYRSADKHFTQEKNAKKVFYGINDIIGESECYIVEGEIDKLSLWEIGIKNCVSVPNGAKDSSDYFENAYKHLRAIEKFFVCVDMDEAGKSLEMDIVKRLGKHKCHRVHFKNKDANDDLQESLLILDDSLKNYTSYPVDGTFTAKDIEEDIIKFYNNGYDEPLQVSNKFKRFNAVFKPLRGQLITVTGIPSHGKALDVNTKIPTPLGFYCLIHLKKGDKVYDENGQECSIVWKSEIWEDRPTYKITFSDNSYLIADENHEWLTDTWESRRSYVNSVKNGREKNGVLKNKGTDQTSKRTFASIKTTGEIISTIKTKNDKRNNHSVNLCKPIVGVKCNYIINPYVLGCWLGDGNSADGGFTSDDTEIIDNIRRNYKVTKRAHKYGYGIIGIKANLRGMNLLNNKHIPNEYLFGSEQDRLQLLCGLMDTDGHCSKVEARSEYCGTNKRLVEDVYKLICSLGIKATFVEADAKLYGKFISKKYRVFFKTNKVVFQLKRKQCVIDEYFKNRKTRGNSVRYITNIERVYGHQTQCIEVDSDSHLFLAGEQCVPTHNSNFIEDYCLNLILENDLKLSAYSPEHFPMSQHQSSFAEKIIGKPFLTDCYGVSRINKMELEKYIEWSKNKIYLTMPEKSTPPNWDWLFQKFEEQIYRYGIDVFIIDAFNKVKMKDGSLFEINDILSRLTLFAQMHGVIVFLVAHPTKMRRDDKTGLYMIPTLYDVKGSGDFYDQSHCGLTVYRYFDSENESGYTKVVTTKIKYRHQGEVNQEILFNFDKSNGRFYEYQEHPTRFNLIEKVPEQKIITHWSEQTDDKETPF